MLKKKGNSFAAKSRHWAAIGFGCVGFLTLLWLIYPSLIINPERGTFGWWTIVSLSLLGGLETFVPALVAAILDRRDAGKAKEEAK